MRNMLQTFKENISVENPEAIASNWRKLRRKILPLLSGRSNLANILDLWLWTSYLMQSLKV